MNNCSFSGTIYKLDDKGDKKSPKVSLRIGFRKRYVSDEDKKANKTLAFAGFSAFGQTAEFILNNFSKGDAIELSCQYDPFENKDGDEVPWFNVNQAFFPAGGNGNGGGKKKDDDDDDRGSRNRRSRDDDDDDRGSRSSRGSSRRSRDEDPEDDAPPRRGNRRREEDPADSPF